MVIDLHRVRFQETYGDRRGDYLEETVTQDEILELLQNYGHAWFPDGHTLTQDPDSPNTWILTEDAGEQRHVFFFVESILARRSVCCAVTATVASNERRGRPHS